MIETKICLTLERKSDIQLIEKILKNEIIDAPIFILELEDTIEVRFKGHYEYRELDNEIMEYFPEYEFISDYEANEEEIRMQIFRYQDRSFIDDWNKSLDALDETIYLVKKTSRKITPKSELFNPKVRVLFEDIEKNYFINIVKGVDSSKTKHGFIVIDSFEEGDIERDILINEPFDNRIDAFWAGYDKLDTIVEKDFEKYKQKAKRKKKRSR